MHSHKFLLIARDFYIVSPGMLREPKWGHLRDLHSALRLCKKALLSGKPSVENFGPNLEVFLPIEKIKVVFLR